MFVSMRQLLSEQLGREDKKTSQTEFKNGSEMQIDQEFAENGEEDVERTCLEDSKKMELYFKTSKTYVAVPI